MGGWMQGWMDGCDVSKATYQSPVDKPHRSFYLPTYLPLYLYHTTSDMYPPSVSLTPTHPLPFRFGQANKSQKHQMKGYAFLAYTAPATSLPARDLPT